MNHIVMHTKSGVHISTSVNFSMLFLCTDAVVNLLSKTLLINNNTKKLYVFSVRKIVGTLTF